MNVLYLWQTQNNVAFTMFVLVDIYVYPAGTIVLLGIKG